MENIEAMRQDMINKVLQMDDEKVSILIDEIKKILAEDTAN